MVTNVTFPSKPSVEALKALSSNGHHGRVPFADVSHRHYGRLQFLRNHGYKRDVSS